MSKTVPTPGKLREVAEWIRKNVYWLPSVSPEFFDECADAWEGEAAVMQGIIEAGIRLYNDNRQLLEAAVAEQRRISFTAERREVEVRQENDTLRQRLEAAACMLNLACVELGLEDRGSIEQKQAEWRQEVEANLAALAARG